ncbi:MAG: hypothetical protein ACE5JH_06395 [Acidobacteriota bacterium]
MRKTLITLSVVFAFAVPTWAQQAETEELIKRLVPYSHMKSRIPSLTLEQYNTAARVVAKDLDFALTPFRSTRSSTYLGRLGANRYDPDSTANPYGLYGSRYSPTSIRNPYGLYGSPYSPNSVTNPYALSAPKLFGQDGRYLGKLSSNPYDPESISNPYGLYGSRHSPYSINNPYGIYGSRYSPLSPNNPYSLSAPVIVVEQE